MTDRRPRIAVFAGPDATVLNSEPLITSNGARLARGLPPRLLPDGSEPRFDALRPQRLAAPVTLWVEAYSAHPLEADAAAGGLYGPPDGWMGADGAVREAPAGPDDQPVMRITLRPEDGLLPLPYVAFQADGRPWDGDEADPFGPPGRARQPFYPDASRVFEEVDRLGVGDDGLAGQLARLADFEHVRVAPPAGWTSRGEARGTDFWAYRPPHLLRQPARPVLAAITNRVAQALGSGGFDGGLWLEGSPYVEETTYWLGLLVDTRLPIAGTAAQRPHGAIGDDGARNLVDAVRYLVSGAWADADGGDALGPVVVIDQQVMAARAVQKADARPGGYVVTGGHGGVLGSITSVGRVAVSMRPAWRHGAASEVRLGALPAVAAVARRGPAGEVVLGEVPVKDDDGWLLGSAIPSVALYKHGQYLEDDGTPDPAREVAIAAHLERLLGEGMPGGFVAEGSAPFGTINESAEAALRRAVFSGVPVVKAGRGNADGVSERTYAPFAIAGGTLTATKARLLLMAAILRLGALPVAADPARPTPEEMRAARAALDRYQAIFDTH